MLKRLLFICLVSAGTLPTAHADNWLSWSEFDRDGENMQIYLSREAGDDVGPVHKITHRGMNITPSLLITADEIWIAWVDRANRLNYRLRYARIDPDTQNLLESGSIATSDNKVYSPVFAVTATGIPVLAWSGWDGGDEEIRLAYFLNGRWGTENKITSNIVPDTLPVFITSQDGKPTLSWERISNDEVTIHSYTLNSDFVSTRSKNSKADSTPGTASSRQNALNSTSIQRLPVSLQSRQKLFFSGNRATAYK